MPNGVDNSFLRLPNGLAIPFELRREVVPVKLQLQLQLQHFLAPTLSRLSPYGRS